MDYYSSAGSSRFHQSLLQLGFESWIDTSRSQQGVSCGYVGARVATDCRLAAGSYHDSSDWYDRDVTGAVDERWITRGNTRLENLQGHASTFLSESNVHRLASEWWNDERIWDMPDDPRYRAASEWLSVDSYDYSMLILARRLFLAAIFGESQPISYHVVNTDKSGRSGSHWFTVVYEICVTAALPAGQVSISEQAARHLDVDRRFLRDLKDDHVQYFREFDLSPLLGRTTVDLGEAHPEEDIDNADECDECNDADVDHHMEQGIDRGIDNADECDDADVDHNMQQGIDIRGIDSADECDEEDRGEPAEMDYYASEAEDFDD